MSKVRVFQLARDLNVESKYLIDLMQAAGVDVRSPSSTVELEAEQAIRDMVAGKRPMPKAPPKEKDEARPTPPAPGGAIPAPGGKRLAQIPKAKTAATALAGEAPPIAVMEQPAEVVVSVEEPQFTQPVLVAETPSVEPISEPDLVVEPQVESTVEPIEGEDKSLARPDVPPVEVPIPPQVNKPIPIPIQRPMNIPSPTAQTRDVNKRLQQIKERRSARPLFAPVPAPLRTDSTKRKAEGPVQRPVMKLTSEAVKGGRMQVPDAVRAAVGIDQPPPPVFGDNAPGAKRGGPPGRNEERERRKPLKPGRRRNPRTGLEEDDDKGGKRGGLRQRGGRRTGPIVAAPKGPVVLELPITVRSFSELTGVRYNELARKLMSLDIMATINANLTEEQAELLGVELGLSLEIRRPKDAEAELLEEFAKPDDDPSLLIPRPPIVTFMGHVDHGKTSLMDRIRSANVAAGESGGITQHIGAYQVKVNENERITFLDTPGHEAFTSMRARGANLTDIVVLVVAADDGVMPQTEEAINHAKAAEVSIVVAMNKIDLPGAKVDRLQQQLARYELISEAWGGDTLMVGTSAITGQGIPELLESINIVAELKELKANPNRAANGTCIEASLSEGRGVQCTLLVRNGTLRRGDIVLCGQAFGRVRSMVDHLNRPVDEAGPSMPVVLSGLDFVPDAGQDFFVVNDLSKARAIAEIRRDRARIESRAARQHVTLEKFYDTLQEKKVRELLLILKADVRGSIEAIRKEISDFVHDEVRVRIIHDGVGGITEGDVILADASDAIIVGFHVAPDERAISMASEKGVEIRRYDIIYQVSDDIKKALEGMLKPESREMQLGRAVVQEVYPISRVGTIAGCRVVQGTIERSAKCRVIRDGTVIGAYAIQSLKRVKDDAKEVREGLECGIKLVDFNDIKRGDLLEAFKIEEIKRTL